MAGDGATSAFAGDPQPVEVFHRGRWYAGELLGWRHDEQGHCSARVRVVRDRLRHSAWVELTDLRLPVPAGQAPPPPAARKPATAPRPPAVRPDMPDDTQPHLLLPRPARPPVPPAVVPGSAAVPPRAAPTTRGLPLPDAVPVG